MQTLLAILLLINAVFSVAVWPPFLKRVKQDPRARDADGRPTRFLRVHAILIGIALTIAAISAIAGITALFV